MIKISPVSLYHRFIADAVTQKLRLRQPGVGFSQDAMLLLQTIAVVAIVVCSTIWLSPIANAADEVVEKPILFNDNGAWSWFEDERAIVDATGGKILVSSVADNAGSGGGDRSGDIDVVSYDIASGNVDQFVLHHNLQDDDHNSAALIVRPDGRYLAMYARHGNDPFSRWRISTNPHDASSWNPEQRFTNGAGTTYSNLHYLPNDDDGAGRMYNFVRTLNYDPNLLVSDDEGSTWSYGGKLLTEGGGGDRPYLRYFSNDNRIHLIATERHPRNYDNSIYHGYIEDGQLFGTAGNLLDSNLLNSFARSPDELTPILSTGTVIQGSAMRHGWTVDVSIDGSGNPVAVHQARADNDDTDHRFFYSRWDGSEWNTHQLAYAGSYLYGAENDYTGLVAIDPDDENVVYLSSEVHPDTKAQLIGADGQRHYELFRGVTSDSGQSWNWTPITYNSTQDHLRPIVPKWDADNTAVLWLQGNYNTYTSYDTDVVGLVNPNITQLDSALSVDFGATGQLVQSGFQAFTREANPGGSLQTENYPSDYAVEQGAIAVSLGGALGFRDRGDDVDSPMGDVVDDFVFADDTLTLTLGNLEEGDYQIVLYSHDRDFFHGEFSVFNEGRQVGILDPTAGDSPDVGVASARYWFHADGSNDVVLSLATPNSGNVPLNGFELYASDAPFAEPPFDLNGDGDLNLADYLILNQNMHSDLSSLSSLEAFSKGDLNGDQRNDHTDFVIFRNAFEQWHGAGSFAQAVKVPEVTSMWLVATGFISTTIAPLRHRFAKMFIQASDDQDSTTNTPQI